MILDTLHMPPRAGGNLSHRLHIGIAQPSVQGSDAESIVAVLELEYLFSSFSPFFFIIGCLETSQRNQRAYESPHRPHPSL